MLSVPPVGTCENTYAPYISTAEKILLTLLHNPSFLTDVYVVMAAHGFTQRVTDTAITRLVRRGKINQAIDKLVKVA